MGLVWVPQETSLIKLQGDTHIFLHSYLDNWMDIMLVLHLLVENLFPAGFGQTCKAWRCWIVSSICAQM